MSQTNPKYKRLESLLSGSKLAEPDPVRKSSDEELEALKAQIAKLEAASNQQAGDQRHSTAELKTQLAHLPAVGAGGKQRHVRQAASESGTKTNAFRITLIGLPASILAASFYLYLAFTTGAWQLYAWSADIWLLALAVLTSMILVRRGRVSAGAWLLLAAVQVTFIGAVALIQGIGLLVGVSLAILVSIIAGQTLSTRVTGPAIILGLASGVAAVLLDLFGPAFRFPEPEPIRIFLPGILGVVILLYGYVTIRQFPSYSLSTKMILAFASVTLLSVGIVFYFVNRSYQAALTTTADNNLLTAASQVATRLDDFIRTNQDIVRTQAQAPDLAGYLSLLASDQPADEQDAARVRVLGLLRSYIQRNPQDITSYALLDRSGLVVADTVTVDTWGDKSDQEFFTTALQTGQPYASPPILSTTKTGEADLYFSSPVRNAAGEIIGVLLFTCNAKELQQLIVQANGIAGAGSFAVLLDENHIRLAHGTTPDLVFKSVVPLDPAKLTELQAVHRLPSGTAVDLSTNLPDTEASLQNIDKQPVFIGGSAAIGGKLAATAVAKMKTQPWIVYVRQSQDVFLAPIQMQTRTVLLLTLVIASMAIILAYILARSLTNPILHLTSTAVAVASGDLTAEARLETQDETGALALAFNKMTAQLRNLIGSLEQHVAERTQDLEVAAEVSRAVSEKTADIDSLLREAVELISERFHLYYSQLYLADPTGHILILCAGSGEIGAELLRRGHRLPIGSGSINGRAAAEKASFIVADTSQSADFKPNLLLPDTRCEMSIPLIAGGKVVGVLDMQSRYAGTLNETNLPAFEALASQLAIALQNAALFADAEKAHSELEVNMRRLVRTGWADYLNAIQRPERIGYVFDQNEIVPVANAEALRSASGQELIAPIAITGEPLGTFSVELAKPTWGAETAEFVNAVARQVSQQIENLRLLESAQQYRAEAENAVRRLTRQGWEVYLKSRSEQAAGYVFDLNAVQTLDRNSNGKSSGALTYPLVVRDENIGELAVDSILRNSEAADIVAAVAQQLSGHIENLRLTEQNEERAHELETVAEVSATTATLLDPDRLLQTVVDVTKERFGVYHAHIYLADDTWQTLLLAAGAGEVGRKMIAEEHAIALDAEKSLVARAARERQAAIVNDVRSDPGFLPNPFLPETQSEMAVPMIVGDKVIGVFDVQANAVNGFSDEDAHIYTTLASQVAVALQNARLYAEQAATVTQLRELDRLKSSFLANMSHELRTPLNSILGFTDVMLEQIDGPLTSNMNNDLQLIQKNGQHLLNLINDVLDMAKIEAGKMNLNPERFRVHEILEEVVNITSPLASERSLSLFIENDSDHEVDIFADRTRLRQVMLNLVNNAMKFTEKGKISLHVERRDEQVLIKVKDTGIGIPPDKLESIFQEFAQVDTSATRKVGGTGLGLPISRRLIEMHGGRLWAESSGVSGEGSTFFVELPIEARIAESIEVLEK